MPLLREGESDRRDQPVAARKSDPFSDKQIALLQTFADQAVIAIENVAAVRRGAGTHARSHGVAEQQTATADVLEVISSSPGELEPVFETMLENATRICGANFGIDEPVRR